MSFRRLRKVTAIIASVATLSILSVTAFAESDWSNYNTETTTEIETTSEAIAPIAGATDGILAPTDPTGSSNVTIPGKDVLINSTDSSSQIYAGYVDIIPQVSTDDLLQWATTKGNEIIYILQIICQPVTIIGFIIAAFLTLIGALGKGGKSSGGIWGMVVSALVYAAVLYAPVILQTFVGWVAS